MEIKKELFAQSDDIGSYYNVLYGRFYVDMKYYCIGELLSI
jgi:hypothetical protein